MRPPGKLWFFKDAAMAASTGNAISDPVNLSLILDFEVITKKGKDHGYLKLLLPDEEIQLR